jgi:hypothetical protein
LTELLAQLSPLPLQLKMLSQMLFLLPGTLLMTL